MALTNVVSHATPKKSWADIVKGRSAAKVEPLRPAARGSHWCVCTGEFLVMLGHYGWIMALQDIDHPEADRHGGRIYLRATDLRPGYTPKQGDEVTFFLYVDDNGLGAEDCYATHDPQPPQPPQSPVPRRRGFSQSKNMRGTPPIESKNCLSAAAKEFVPTVLVPLNADDENVMTMNPEAKEFIPAPPGLCPSLGAEATDFIPLPGNLSSNMYCPINTKRFYDDDDDDDSSDDGTDSTASSLSGRVLVAPGLSTFFVSKGKPEPRQHVWSSLSSRCAQAVTDADTDGDSWCDDDSDDDLSFSGGQHRAEEWAAVSARCAQAVGKVHHEHPWHARNAAAAAKLKADVGDDIRWEVVLDALVDLDGGASIALPPGLAPPGLAPPGLAPPGLVPPGLA